MHALMRFLSWRVVAALLVAAPLMCVARELVGWWLPEGIDQISSEGLSTMRRLVGGLYSFAFGTWSWLLARSVAGAFPRRATPWIKRMVRAWCWGGVLVAVPITTRLIFSCCYLSWSEVAPVMSACIWITATPIAIACTPLGLVYATELVKASPRLYAWFYAGRGEFGGFASSYTVWQNSEPMPKDLK